MKKNKGKQVRSVPTQFDKAETVEVLAKKLVREYHSGLVNSRIAYLFKNKPIKRSGQEIPATAEKVSPKNKALSGYDFVIVVNNPMWLTLDDAQKNAVIDHCLEHFFIDEDDSGEVKFRILPHDVEEFSSVISRHGLYTKDLVKIGDVVKALKKTSKEPVVRKLGETGDSETKVKKHKKKKMKSRVIEENFID
jgi:hypothetical protein